jgi:hypothetical protein
MRQGCRPQGAADPSALAGGMHKELADVAQVFHHDHAAHLDLRFGHHVKAV